MHFDPLGIIVFSVFASFLSIVSIAVFLPGGQNPLIFIGYFVLITPPAIGTFIVVAALIKKFYPNPRG